MCWGETDRILVDVQEQIEATWEALRETGSMPGLYVFAPLLQTVTQRLVSLGVIVDNGPADRFEADVAGGLGPN